MRLIRYDIGPPGGYRVTDPRTNVSVVGITYGQMMDRISQHWRNMNLEPFNVENAICESLSPEDRHEYCGEPLPWPLLLQPLKLLAVSTDRGLGDIIERLIGPANSDAYKEWYETTFGKTCGCSKRQDNLNIRYAL